MGKLCNLIEDYLDYCYAQKKLNAKTIKAYGIDLRQFREHAAANIEDVGKSDMLAHLSELHKNFKPRTAKRKIASLKAFFRYLEFEEIIENNPFNKIRTRFQEPQSLPKTIPLDTIARIFGVAYEQLRQANSAIGLHASLRDIAILELLFATGMRVSEVCSVKCSDIDLSVGVVRIMGKGAKERVMQVGNIEALTALKRYHEGVPDKLNRGGFFFINRLGRRISEQSVRFMIKRYATIAKIPKHITPHMFRHSFATLLLEQDVDVRCIQRMLGHSSIVTTQIYTHVTLEKQRVILTAKHPRNTFSVGFQKNA